MKIYPVKTKTGKCYLNLGCNSYFKKDWTNLDFEAREYVYAFDLRRRLPFAEAQFDGIYISHVLEHLSIADARKLATECCRILKQGAVFRVVVPDLEFLAATYVKICAEAWTDGREALTSRNHAFLAAFILDAMVKEENDGEMNRVLRQKLCSRDFVEAVSGDSFIANFEPERLGQKRTVSRRLRTFAAMTMTQRLAYVKGILFPIKDPRENGFAHKWMWDRVSLRELAFTSGFSAIALHAWNTSTLADWGVSDLDGSEVAQRARKVESIFFEMIK